MSLTPQEIKSRMSELHNLRQLHTAQGIRIKKQAVIIRTLKAENAALRTTVATQALELQTLKLQIEELRMIVFGKKKKQVTDDELPPLTEEPSTPRTALSYHRPLPTPEEVTRTETFTRDTCDQGHPLSNKIQRICYIHDIPAIIKPEITKHVIDSGYCTICKKQFHGREIPAAPVMFGDHIKRLVATLSTVHRLSHPLIQSVLRLHYSTEVSDGEIAKMIAKEAETLRPEYERLKQSVQCAEIRHIDETGWLVCLDDARGRFCWVVSDALSPARIFALGCSRGKGNADELLGTTEGVVVSDDYGAYRTLKNHQLCFAHLARDLRTWRNRPHLLLRLPTTAVTFRRSSLISTARSTCVVRRRSPITSPNYCNRCVSHFLKSPQSSPHSRPRSAKILRNI